MCKTKQFTKSCVEELVKCRPVNDDAPGSLGPFFHLTTLKSQRTASWSFLEHLLSSHFHLAEIQQGTKYLWRFNPTCQSAAALAFICSALPGYTLHIWRPSITKPLRLRSRPPPCMFKLLQEPELLDLFIQPPGLSRDTHCLQPRPATR